MMLERELYGSECKGPAAVQKMIRSTPEFSQKAVFGESDSLNLAILSQMDARVDLDKEDSDSAYFDALIRYASLASELAVLVVINGLINDKDRLRYKYLYDAIRVDSPGGWQGIIDSILTGPAGQFLHPGIQAMTRDLSERVSSGWQTEAVRSMAQVLSTAENEPLFEQKKASGRDWIRLVSELRNKQLSHGFPTPAIRKLVVGELERSVRLFLENLGFFNRLECAFLSQNLSGKYRVSPVSADAPSFSYLKSERSHKFQNGIYMWLGEPVRMHLIETNVDLSDFWIPNGNYRNKSYELYSFATSNRRREGSELFEDPPGRLASSETEGAGEVRLLGKSITNLPLTPDHYVERNALETELAGRLSDDYTRIITLNGRGGIGKTSLALTVLHDVAHSESFDLILWFSARDIDLTDVGPKPVRPQAISENDIATRYFNLLGDAVAKGDAVPGFEKILSCCPDGKALFVFDNFETVQNPGQLYAWLDLHLRLPNKVLITTRLRQAFKGDYQIDVNGMSEPESELLVDTAAKVLSVETLITDAYRGEIVREADGHPYVLKILVSAVKKAGRAVKVERLVAGAGDILTALFERTYINLSLPAQRMFLTLCSWRSVVPRVALEAVTLRSANDRIDVTAAIDELVNSSLIEIPLADREADEQIAVPLTAIIFGQKKLAVSPLQATVQADSQLLQMLGASASKNDTNVSRRFDRLLNNIDSRLAIAGVQDYNKFAGILEYIAGSHSSVRLRFARISELYGGSDRLKLAKEQLLKAVEDCKDDESADCWRAYVDFARRNRLRMDEVHGLVQLASQGDAEFFDISEAANRLNTVLSEDKSILDVDERRVVIHRLAALLTSRIEGEGDARDFSRLAWLHLNIDETADATMIVRSAFGRWPDNEYLKNLAKKLEVESLS